LAGTVSPPGESPPVDRGGCTVKMLRLVVLLSFAVVASTIGPARASGGPAAVGHLYVNDNTAGTNTVAAFDRHADGTLTPLPGSPFAVGGAGTGTGIGSQGALQATPD